MDMRLATKSDYPTLIDLWERSVCATHDFLPQHEIEELRPLILGTYFDAVDLTVALNRNGQLLGFCGVQGDNIEMLFIDPEVRGQGVGRLLAQHAIVTQEATKVDVNEQNPQALGFYEHLGFEVVSRSPLDGQGKPYPLLHLIYKGPAI
ncbi:acetyltransferase [Terasakiella pusilla]|uniref:acetyltransferase n=1 Tax=Terasakiella pusilla TaxID=64973 RepID=UPI003AA927B9